MLTVPFELRARLAYDGKLCGAVCRIFVDSVLGFYQRRMRDLDPSLPRGKSGAVPVVQRLNMDLRLHPHNHALLLDGVYVASGDGELRFCPLPMLSSTDVAELLQVVRVRSNPNACYPECTPWVCGNDGAPDNACVSCIEQATAMNGGCGMDAAFQAKCLNVVDCANLLACVNDCTP